MVCVSEYGDLLNVKPMTKLASVESKGGKEDLRQVFMIDDNQDHKGLIKKMNHNPKAYFLFNPNGHYVNAMTIYTALKKSLDVKHYGNPKKKNKHGEGLAEQEPDQVSFKGTAFHQCDIPYDVFHMSRRTKLVMKQ